MSRLTHLDEAGRARMVDVSAKYATARTARAEGALHCAAGTLDLVRAVASLALTSTIRARPASSR